VSELTYKVAWGISGSGDRLPETIRAMKDMADHHRAPNSPFLAGAIQLQKFDFLLIAPATANTVAKISLGIADTLLCNAAIMALKAFVPVYVMPSDYQEGIVITKLPNGRDLRLKIRKEDVAHVTRLSGMEGITVLKTPEAITNLFTEIYSH
jgi:flavoprotein